MEIRFTPAETPFALKILLALILASSLLSHWIAPYLALSAAGIAHLYLWQFATYALIHPLPSAILHLAFNLFLIWTFGASLMERLHTKLFFSLFFGAAAASGLAAWGAMTLFHTSLYFFGSSAPLYALLTAWVLLNPEARLLLFFALPLKARHLLLGLIGFNILIDLSRSNWVPLFAYLASVLFGYLFTIAACRIRSPFPFLMKFENGILRFLERLSQPRQKGVRHTKIYDFKSGEPILSDDEFMDAMLAKISLYGEDSLNPEDRKRMQEISEKKSLGKKL